MLFDSAISDLHTCLKLVPLSMLRRMRLVELGFGLDTEITAQVLRTGSRPFEVPISYFSRSHSEGKKINWRDAVHCVRVLGRVRLTRMPREHATASSVALPSEQMPHQQHQAAAVVTAGPVKGSNGRVLVLSEPAGTSIGQPVLTEAAE